MTRKIFDSGRIGPPYRVNVDDLDFGTDVYLTEDGERVGLIELRPGMPVDLRGECQPGTIAEWGDMHFHASGDRCKIDHRLTLRRSEDGVKISHSNRQRQVLGPKRRPEHDWERIEGWYISHDSVVKVNPNAPEEPFPVGGEVGR